MEKKYCKKCPVHGMCGINGGCILDHELFRDLNKHDLKAMISLQRSSWDREKKIIELLQERKPPKVNRGQINHYYQKLKMKKVDLDKKSRKRA